MKWTKTAVLALIVLISVSSIVYARSPQDTKEGCPCNKEKGGCVPSEPQINGMEKGIIKPLGECGVRWKGYVYKNCYYWKEATHFDPINLEYRWCCYRRCTVYKKYCDTCYTPDYCWEVYYGRPKESRGCWWGKPTDRSCP